MIVFFFFFFLSRIFICPKFNGLVNLKGSLVWGQTKLHRNRIFWNCQTISESLINRQHGLLVDSLQYACLVLIYSLPTNIRLAFNLIALVCLNLCNVKHLRCEGLVSLKANDFWGLSPLSLLIEYGYR